MKTITISQAEQATSSSVFALNTSGGNGQPKGIMNVQIVEGNGRASVIRIPVTFIPIDLTSYATKSALLMSPDFRRLVTKKLITLVDSEEAEKELSKPAAQEEQRRIMNIERQHEVQEGQMPQDAQNIMAEADGKIGGFAMNIAHTTDGDEDAIVSNLRNNAENLSKEELQYIVNNSAFHKVKGLAAELIVR